jgi:hypothetical protein
MQTEATGTFEIKMGPQTDASHAAGRMTIDKTYSGDLVGTGTGQMISKRTESGSAMYFAIEEFEGALRGMPGGFTLMHQGKMSKEASSLNIIILEGSGYGKLEGITGSYNIIRNESGHAYELTYDFAG